MADAATLAKLAALPSIRPETRTELHKVPRWAKYAAIRIHFLGVPRKEAVADAGKTMETYRHWRKSPAMRNFVNKIKELGDDPTFIAQTLLRANAMDLTMDALMNLEAAKDAGDYKEVAVILRDLMDRSGVTKQAPPSQKIVLQIGSSSLKLESTPVESSYEVITANIED